MYLYTNTQFTNTPTPIADYVTLPYNTKRTYIQVPKYYTDQNGITRVWDEWTRPNTDSECRIMNRGTPTWTGSYGVRNTVYR